MPSIHGTTPLNEATGTVNVVAIVKYFRQPERTRGSGYSQFVSISDPSLHGGKIPCVLFDDAIENLPKLESIGDVIVMHRLTFKEYQGRNQACGYGTTGFRCAVFLGSPTSPLTPIHSSIRSELTRDELSNVNKLRVWFHSPNCPVERETTVGRSTLPKPTTSGSTRFDMVKSTPLRAPSIRCLADLRLNQFVNIDAQIVGIYPFPAEDRCTILYLWDGSFATSQSPPTFFAPPKRQLHSLLSTAKISPLLAGQICHLLKLPASRDWSVAVFVYDEHVANSQSLQPGDLIRLTNLHVVQCRLMECKRPGCLRLIMHGGGQSFKRGITLLERPNGDSRSLMTSASLQHSTAALKANLSQGQAARRPFLLSRLVNDLGKSADSRQLPPILIGQACSIPSLMHEQEASQFNNATPLPQFEAASRLRIPLVMDPISWLPITCSQPDHVGAVARKRVQVRLVGRVIGIYPSTPPDLADSIIVKCNNCSTAVRLSSLPEGSVCDCKQQAIYSLLPFILLRLADPSGSVVICVVGSTALRFLATLSRSNDTDADQAPSWWLKLAKSALLATFSETDNQMINSWLSTSLGRLKGQLIDARVEMDWQPQWDFALPVVAAELDISFRLVDTGWTIRHDRK